MTTNPLSRRPSSHTEHSSTGLRLRIASDTDIPAVVSLTLKAPVETSNLVPAGFPLGAKVRAMLAANTWNPIAAGEGDRVTVETVWLNCVVVPKLLIAAARKK